MIDLGEIRAQALRRYTEYLSSLVAADPDVGASAASVFPIDIRFGKVKSGEAVERWQALKNELLALRDGSDESGKPSYRIDWEERQDRIAGAQRFPARIYFPDEAALLGFLGKKAEAARFRGDAAVLLSAFPALRGWAAKKPPRIVEHSGDWERLTAVLSWLRDHRLPGVFLREVPAVEDTKFVERNKAILRELIDEALPGAAIDPAASAFEDRYGFRKSEPLVRLRVLDERAARERLSGLTDISMPAGDLDDALFPELRTILIFENKTNFANVDAFLTLPALSGYAAIFGSGFAVHSLKAAEKLRERRVLYWGDIDTQGLRILAALRSSVPACESVLMDRETFDLFPEYRTDAPAEKAPPPDGLNEAEAALYRHLVSLEKRNRLEQERIPVGHARAALSHFQITSFSNM